MEGGGQREREEDMGDGGFLLDIYIFVSLIFINVALFRDYIYIYISFYIAVSGLTYPLNGGFGLNCCLKIYVLLISLILLICLVMSSLLYSVGTIDKAELAFA